MKKKKMNSKCKYERQNEYRMWERVKRHRMDTNRKNSEEERRVKTENSTSEDREQ